MTMDWSNVMIELSLPKKLVKHAVGGFSVFSFSLKHFKYMLKQLELCNGWRVLGMRQQVSATRIIRVAPTVPEQNRKPSYMASFVRLATLGIVARRVCQRGPRVSSRRGFFPPSLFTFSPPRKSCCPLQKSMGQTWF